MDIFTWQDDADTTLMLAIWRMSAHAWRVHHLDAADILTFLLSHLGCGVCGAKAYHSHLLAHVSKTWRQHRICNRPALKQSFAETKIVRKINLASRLATLCRTGSPPWSAGSGQCRDRPEYRCPGKDSPKLVQVGSYLGQEVPTRVDDDCLNLI